MKKAFFMCLLLAASVLYATNSQANQLTINNGKNCQFAVTFLFASGGSISPGIGANGSVTIDFDAEGEDVIGAIFYDATTGARLLRLV